MIEKKVDRYLKEMPILKSWGTKWQNLYKLIGYKEKSLPEICAFCDYVEEDDPFAYECMNIDNDDKIFNYLEKTKASNPWIDATYVKGWGTCKNWKRSKLIKL